MHLNRSEIFNTIAKKGGFCEDTLSNIDDFISIKCSNGHLFYESPKKLLNGSWCKKCNLFLGEEICRLYLESVLKIQLPKKRPKFLCINNKSRYELDGYNEEHKIAFEHQGLQHYQFVEYFHKDYSNFLKQKNRDKRKLKLCKKNDVKLIIIPSLFYLTMLKDLPNLVELELKRLRIHYSKLPKTSDVDFSLVYKNSELLNLKKLARERGGKLISDVFLSSRVKLLWKCGINSHRPWYSYLSSIKRGYWCSECANINQDNTNKRNSELRLVDMKKYAKEKRGTLLSTEYRNTHDKLLWKCHNTDHSPFLVSRHNIRKGRWCPECSKTKKKTLIEMQDIAKKFGGFCLSTKYVSSSKKLIWKCHVSDHAPWKDYYYNIIKGGWCKLCLSDEKLKIIKSYASFLGGDCLSLEFKHSKTKMLWKCSNYLHDPWLASWSSVKSGSWCPNCFNEYRIKDFLYNY